MCLKNHKCHFNDCFRIDFSSAKVLKTKSLLLKGHSWALRYWLCLVLSHRKMCKFPFYLDGTPSLWTSWCIRCSSSAPVMWYNYQLYRANNYRNRKVEECPVFCSSGRNFYSARIRLAATLTSFTCWAKNDIEIKVNYAGKDLCECFVEDNAVLSQGIYIWRVRICVAVTSQCGPQIIDNNQ